MTGSSDWTRGVAVRHPVRPGWEVVAGRFGVLRTHLSCRLPAVSQEWRQPAQVDRRHGHGEDQLGAFKAAQLQLPQCAVLLAVTKDGFDQLANDFDPALVSRTSELW